jgi:hypothetical protein
MMNDRMAYLSAFPVFFLATRFLAAFFFAPQRAWAAFFAAADRSLGVAFSQRAFAN